MSEKLEKWWLAQKLLSFHELMSWISYIARHVEIQLAKQSAVVKDVIEACSSDLDSARCKFQPIFTETAD